MYIELYIVDADITVLLGFEVLEKKSLTPCMFSNRVVKRAWNGGTIYLDEWYMPMVRSAKNHFYAEIHLCTDISFRKPYFSKLR